MEVGTTGSFDLKDTRDHSQVSVSGSGDVSIGAGSLKTGDVSVRVSEGKSITLEGGPSVVVRPSGTNMPGRLELANSAGSNYSMESTTAADGRCTACSRACDDAHGLGCKQVG